MSEIRLHGRGGQGTVLAAEMLANAFVLGGLYASVFPSYGIERRGSAVMAFARYSKSPIREKTRVYEPEILLILDPTLAEKDSIYDGFKAGGTIIASTKSIEHILQKGVKPGLVGVVDAKTIALEDIGRDIPNTIMLGAFAKTTGLITLKDLKWAVEQNFSGKILEKNLRALEHGYNETQISKFDFKFDESHKKPTFEIEKVSCKNPPPTKFESAWSDCDKAFATINTGEWRLVRPVYDKDKCIRCGMCNVYCPAGCVKVVENVYNPDYKYCKGCGICANECPVHAIEMIKEEGF